MALPPGYRFQPGTHSRTVITPAGELLSRRQAENISAQLAGHTSLSAQRRAGGLRAGISDEERANRASWRRTSEAQGLDARIRNNADFRLFNQELKDIERSKQHLIGTLGKRNGAIEYRNQRVDTYYKFGLITQAQRDKYKGV